MKDLLLNLLQSEVFWTVLGSVLGAVLVFLRRKRQNNALEDGISFACAAMKEIAPLTKNTWDDKAALFLSKVKERMDQEHSLPLTAKGEEKAKEVFAQLYGAVPGPVPEQP